MKNNWDIHVSAIDKYQLVEITDHAFRFNYSLFITVLASLFEECQVIGLSQFIDESQGMLDQREDVLAELTENYGVKVTTTVDYASENQPANGTREYVLHAIGMPGADWLRSILVFGGASLSHVMYGLKTVDHGWLDAMVNMNQTFTKWYWLETSDLDLILLREKVNILCWNSDSHLNVLIEESQRSRLFGYIKEAANKNSLVVNVKQEQ